MTDEEVAVEAVLGVGLYAASDGYSMQLRAMRRGINYRINLSAPELHALIAKAREWGLLEG